MPDSPQPTCDMVDDLAAREGVTEYWVPPHQGYALIVGGKTLQDTGPVRILIVTD
jgi:hypothetical protein